MIKTNDIIAEFENIENLYGLCAVGSYPEIIEPCMDVDLVFIIDDYSRKNETMDSIHKILMKITSKYENLDFSFRRGPVKSKNPLISLLVFGKDEIQKQPKPVLLSWRNTAKTIRGSDINSLFYVEKVERDDVKKEIEKYRTTILNKKTNNYEWMKSKNDWILNRFEKKLKPDEIEWFMKYIIKNIQKNSSYFMKPAKEPGVLTEKNVLEFLDSVEKQIKI